MAILTQRLIMIIILMNLIIGSAQTLMFNPKEVDYTDVSAEVNFLEQKEEDFQTEDGIWGSVKAFGDRVYESSIGSPIRWGWTLLQIFIRAVYPFSISPTQFSNQLEKGIVWVFGLFRSLLIILVMLEGYLVFKNKKSS